MKLNKILKGAACVVLSGTMLMSCSSDYLQLSPVTAESASTISESAEGAKLGIYGICRAMYMQYNALDGYMFVNGEPWMQMFYGDIFGQDYYSNFWSKCMGNINMNWGSMTLPNGWQSRLMWMYGYNLINMSNNILGNIDNAEGSVTDLHFRKAQALTIRAHAYVRLLQVYAPRWVDSNNGNTACLVIRTPEDGIDVPVSTMKEVLDVIYADLDAAIALYDEVAANGAKREYNWEPDKSIAQGIYARAALLQEDWATAEKMAHDARQGYEIMTMDQYKEGFCEANQEWMWNNAAQLEGVYYWAYGSVYACNGPYPILWGYGAGSMNIDLYRQMDPNDGRRALYLMPDNLAGYRGCTEETFWNPSSVDPTDLDISSKDNRVKRAVESYGYKMIPNGDVAKFNEPYKAWAEDASAAEGTKVTVALGAHYKFWGIDKCGTDSYPFMRASEMLLTEAEAAYHLGHTSTTIACLNELNSKRIPGYSCTKSGQDLLDEVRLSRRIELWGEGFNWHDMKRWNLPIVRRAWVAEDVTSGNIPAVNAGTYEPSFNNGWRFSLPRSESDYNHAIELSTK